MGEDSDDDNDDESMMEEIPDFHVSPREALVLYDKIMGTTGIDTEDRKSLSTPNKKWEKLVITTKKETPITIIFFAKNI